MRDRLGAFLYRDDVAAGGEGPLAGLTIGVKANIAVKGMPFHAGIGAWKERKADADAQVVACLRGAGAAIIGILNMEEGALGAKTDNPHFGRTYNPHRPGYSPGGSSGGSGAAVAAGLCDAALGTDTMGSVRIPAAHCGIYGFKPATARVSQTGLIPADPDLDAIGPLAADLDTLERVARVMSDFGEGDGGEGNGGEGDGDGAVHTVSGHKVELHPDVAQGFAHAFSHLAKPTVHTAPHPLSRVRFAGFISVAKKLAVDLADVAVSDHLARLIAYGTKRSPEDWATDQAILARTRAWMRAIVKSSGCVVLPSVPNPAFPHSAPEPASQADFTCLANIAGLPALSLPAGWTREGLPVGVQIIGAEGAEAGLFRIARELDSKLGGFAAPPNNGEMTCE